MATRTPAGAGTEARTRILDSAERLFALHGFDGTATSLIARAAGVPKGLLFYYFPAKFDILSTLLGERLAGIAIDPKPLVVPGNPVRALLNVSERLFRDQADSDVLRVIVWREEHTHPEVRSALSRYRHALHDTIEQVLVGSLIAPVAGGAVHAAAAAWAAIVTARPLEGPDDGADAAAAAASGPTAGAASGSSPTHASAAGAIPRGVLHTTESLRSVAELICSGLGAAAVG